MLSCVMVCLFYLNMVYATTFQSGCPDLANSQADCTQLTNDLKCSTDEDCKIQGQVCCFNGCGNVCTNPVYFKGLCPETDILSSYDEWTKFCLGDCNCPDAMQCCPGPCQTHVCRFSQNKRVDCPSPETYNCDASRPLVNSCTGHNNCIGNDQLCCPDGCNNRFCQDPEYHEDNMNLMGIVPLGSQVPQVSGNVDKTESETHVEKSPPKVSIPCNETSGTCFDITETVLGQPLEEFFPLGAVFRGNTAEKCAALCLFWGFQKILLTTEIGCFCFNGTLDRLSCKSEETCSFACPGGGTRHCGGIFVTYVNIYPSNIVTIDEAKTMFPSGMCYEPKVNKNGQLMADDLPKLQNLTPDACRTECRHRGFAWSCTYLGHTCGCYTAAKKPSEVAEFQDYCNAKCTGDATGVERGITCGGQPTPAVAVVNCLPVV